MAITMLHLVDDQGEPVETDVRIAVEAAFRQLMRRFPEIDEVVLAEFAETLALSMSLRRSKIVKPKPYAQTALSGELNDWIRTHQGFEIAVAETEDLERLAGAAPAGKGIDTDLESEILFAQIRKHLTERDRHILMLIEQDLDRPAGYCSCAKHKLRSCGEGITTYARTNSRNNRRY